MTLYFKKWLELNDPQSNIPLSPQQLKQKQQANQSIAQASGETLTSIQKIPPNASPNDPNKARAAKNLVQHVNMKDLATSAKDMVTGLTTNESVPRVGAVNPAKLVPPMHNPFAKKISGVVNPKKMKK
jgi:hypothetical protein